VPQVIDLSNVFTVLAIRQLIELIRIVIFFLMSPVSMLRSFLNVLAVSSQRKSKRLLDDGGYTDQVKRPRNG